MSVSNVTHPDDPSERRAAKADTSKYANDSWQAPTRPHGGKFGPKKVEHTFPAGLAAMEREASGDTVKPAYLVAPRSENNAADLRFIYRERNHIPAGGTAAREILKLAAIVGAGLAVGTILAGLAKLAGY